MDYIWSDSLAEQDVRHRKVLTVFASLRLNSKRASSLLLAQNTISRAPAFVPRRHRAMKFPIARTQVIPHARTHARTRRWLLRCCLPTRVTTFSDHSARYRSSCPAVHAPRRRGTWRTCTWRTRCFALAQGTVFLSRRDYEAYLPPQSLTSIACCLSIYRSFQTFSFIIRDLCNLCTCDLRHSSFYFFRCYLRDIFEEILFTIGDANKKIVKR